MLNEAKHTFSYCLLWFDNKLVFISSFALLFLALMICSDVMLRFFFNSPLPAGAEISELIMPYIAFCTLGYTLSKGTHIRITLAIEKAPKSRKIVFEIICSVFGLLCCAVVTYYSWVFFWDAFIINELMVAIVKIPWWIGKFSMSLGFFFLTLRYLLNLIELFSGYLIRQ